MTLDYIVIFLAMRWKAQAKKGMGSKFLDFCASNDIIKKLKRENICNPTFDEVCIQNIWSSFKKKQITQLKMGKGLINKFLQEDTGTFNKHIKDVQHY